MGADTATPSATPPASSKKRKHADPAASSSSAKRRSAITSQQATLTSDALNDNQPTTPSKKTRFAKPPPTPTTEKRLRREAPFITPPPPPPHLFTHQPTSTNSFPHRFRPHPPKSFHDLYARATTQRFYVLSRTRNADNTEETVELTGSTGNIYTVTVARQPRCDCPHARSAADEVSASDAVTQCKHVVYVLARVLRARFDLVYQLALLGGEVREVLEGAPPVAGDGDDEDGGLMGKGGGGGGKRKPVDGDCPICFCEMEVGKGGAEAVVWCRAACGQNVHKACFETWAATKRRQQRGGGGGGGGEVTCPYCRSVWEGDEDMVKAIRRNGEKNAEGYVNVADQLGISTQRDYSTYSRWWSGHPSSYRRRYY